jgi:hypothetical protein
VCFIQPVRARNIAPEGVAKRFVTKSTNATSTHSLTVSDCNGESLSNGRGVNVARQRQQPFATARDVALCDTAIAPDVGLLQN